MGRQKMSESQTILEPSIGITKNIVNNKSSSVQRGRGFRIIHGLII